MNVPEFVRDPSENVYEQVADHIAARIEAGDLPPGAMLPNERHLAAEYGVAIGTSRKAAELLEERGLIKIRRAKGKFVLTGAERRQWAEREGRQPGEATDGDV